MEPHRKGLFEYHVSQHHNSYHVSSHPLPAEAHHLLGHDPSHLLNIHASQQHYISSSHPAPHPGSHPVPHPGQSIHQLHPVPKKSSESKPARSVTPYWVFREEQFPKIREEHPNLNSRDVHKEIGARWRSLSDAERKHYEREALNKEKKPQKKLVLPYPVSARTGVFNTQKHKIFESLDDLCRKTGTRFAVMMLTDAGKLHVHGSPGLATKYVEDKQNQELFLETVKDEDFESEIAKEQEGWTRDDWRGAVRNHLLQKLGRRPGFNNSYEAKDGRRTVLNWPPGVPFKNPSGMTMQQLKAVWDAMPGIQWASKDGEPVQSGEDIVDSQVDEHGETGGATHLDVAHDALVDLESGHGHVGHDPLDDDAHGIHAHGIHDHHDHHHHLQQQHHHHLQHMNDHENHGGHHELDIDHDPNVYTNHHDDVADDVVGDGVVLGLENEELVVDHGHHSKRRKFA